MSHNYHSVSQLNETERQLENVTLHTPHIGVEKVTNHTDVVAHHRDLEINTYALANSNGMNEDVFKSDERARISM